MFSGSSSRKETKCEVDFLYNAISYLELIGTFCHVFYKGFRTDENAMYNCNNELCKKTCVDAVRKFGGFCCIAFYCFTADLTEIWQLCGPRGSE